MLHGKMANNYHYNTVRVVHMTFLLCIPYLRSPIKALCAEQIENMVNDVSFTF